jgi:hypothetical protein
MKLYRYYEDCGRMGAIEGLLFLTDEQVEKYKKHTESLWWDELLGKHSEGYFSFSDDTLTVIELPKEAIKALYEATGPVVSGPFDLDYFDEMIEESLEEKDDDYDEED